MKLSATQSARKTVATGVLALTMLFATLLWGNGNAIQAASLYDTSYGNVVISTDAGGQPQVQYTDVSGTVQTDTGSAVAAPIVITTSGGTTANTIIVDTAGLAGEVSVVLSDVNIDTNSSAAMQITGNGNVLIELQGNNNLISQANSGNGLSSKGSSTNISLTGSGALLASGKDCGVYSGTGDLVINSGQITAGPVGAVVPSNAFYGLGDVTINGGSIDGHGRNNGMHVNGTFNMNGGILKMLGTVVNGSNARGLHVVGDTYISGGLIDAQGEKYGLRLNSGSNGGKVFEMTGGTVWAKAITSTGVDLEINANDSFIVDGGNLSGTLTAPNAHPQNSGGEALTLHVLALDGVSAQTSITSGNIDGVACTTTSAEATGAIYGIYDVVTNAAGEVSFYLTNADAPSCVSLYDSQPVRYQNYFVRPDDKPSTTLYRDVALTFDYNDGSAQTNVLPIGYADSFTGTAPSVTPPAHQTFAGWFTQPTGGVAFDFGQPITANTTVYAQYATVPMDLPLFTLPDAVQNEDYSFVIPEATGGLPAYSYSITGLPAGLQYDPATRTISGKATQSGSFSLVLTVTDSSTPALSITRQLTLQVTAAPSTSSSQSNTSASPATSTAGDSVAKTGDSIVVLVVGIVLLAASAAGIALVIITSKKDKKKDE